jgi:hypothetical protein
MQAGCRALPASLVQGSTATSLGGDRTRRLYPIASTRAGSARSGQGRRSVRFQAADNTHKPSLFAPPVAGGYDRGDGGSETDKRRARGTRAAAGFRRPWPCPARVERAGRASPFSQAPPARRLLDSARRWVRLPRLAGAPLGLRRPTMTVPRLRVRRSFQRQECGLRREGWTAARGRAARDSAVRWMRCSFKPRRVR